jgi:hypothetical protein
MQIGEVVYEVGRCKCEGRPLAPYCFHHYAKVLKIYPPMHGNPPAILAENKDGTNIKRIKATDLSTRPSHSWGL